MTKKYAVLGSPIEHSLSPAIHNQVFTQLGVDANYEKFELAEGLEEFLDSKSDYNGFSLTMPLKDLGFEASERLSVTAQNTRSVNTLLRTSTGWDGYNTDVFGIREAIGFRPAQVAVLGSGATARSALAAFPDSQKVISARNSSAATFLAGEFGAELIDFESAIQAEVVISTLPLGALMSLTPKGFQFATILDAAYMNQRVEAENYVSGLEMLLLQAVAQQRIFYGLDENHTLPNEPALVNSLRTLLNVAK
jgi:shikimate dehydrogenase